MEWNIAFMGAVGSGKTTAIASVSDIDCLDTEVNYREGGAGSKPRTTVALDMGVMELGQGDRLRLQGAPGQDRFDYMWDILLQQSRAVVVLVRAGDQAVGELSHYLQQVRQRLAMARREVPIVVGVTHTDLAPWSLEALVSAASSDNCPCSRCRPPVLPVDARQRGSVVALLQVVTALLEAVEQHPDAELHQWHARRLVAEHGGDDDARHH